MQIIQFLGTYIHKRSLEAISKNWIMNLKGLSETVGNLKDPGSTGMQERRQKI